jgi:hypothetical protein
MFKPQLVVAAVALFVGVGLYEDVGGSSDTKVAGTGTAGTPAPGSGPPVGSGDNLNKSSNDVPPKDSAPEAVDPHSLQEPGANDSSFQAPAVPNHDVRGQGITKVDPQALTVFAGNMDTLATNLNVSWKEVSTLANKPVAAGAFPSAVKLAANVTTLAGETSTALNNLVTALRDLRDAVNKIAVDYKTTDEASKMTADKLTTYTSAFSSATSAANSSTH